MKTYFSHLKDAGLIDVVPKASQKLARLEAGEKVYLNNPNQLWAISAETPNGGTIRETFFISMLSQNHSVKVPLNGDFLVDDRLVFEVGGKKKTFEQIKEEQNGFLACDGMELGHGKRIPLWLFGFLC